MPVSPAALVPFQRNLTSSELDTRGGTFGLTNTTRFPGLDLIGGGSSSETKTFQADEGGGTEITIPASPVGYMLFTKGSSGDAGGAYNYYDASGQYLGTKTYSGASGITKAFEFATTAVIGAGFASVAAGAAGLSGGVAGNAADTSLTVQGDSINALDRATGVGYGSEAVDTTLTVQGNSINALDAATHVPYGSSIPPTASGSGLSSGVSLQSVGSVLSGAKTVAGIVGLAQGARQSSANVPALYRSGNSIPSQSPGAGGGGMAGTDGTAQSNFRQSEIADQNSGGQTPVSQDSESLMPLWIAIAAGLGLALVLKGRKNG